MEVILARHAGFCSGVRNAVETVLAESKKGAAVYTLGPLVHNEMVGHTWRNMVFTASLPWKRRRGRSW